MYEVRHMIRADLPALARIEDESFGPLALDENGFDRLQKTGKFLFYAAVDSAHGTPVGHVVLRVAKKGVYVCRVAVHPHHRRCHIGWSLLLRAMVFVTRGERKFCEIQLPDSALPGAARWLLRCGWKQQERVGRDATRFTFQTQVPAAV